MEALEPQPDLEERISDPIEVEEPVADIAEYHDKLKKQDISLSDGGMKWIGRACIAVYYAMTIGCGTLVAYTTSQQDDPNVGGYIVSAYSYALALAPTAWAVVKRLRKKDNIDNR